MEECFTNCAINFVSTFSDDSHWVETNSTLAGFAGYIQTWSGFQAMKKKLRDHVGNEMIEGLLKE